MPKSGFFALPTWLDAFTNDGVEYQRFVIRLAAMYHNPEGSISTLSKALDLSENALTQAASRAAITPQTAIKLERLLGREQFPRELFRPDIFVA